MYWQSRQQLVAPVQSVRFAVKPPSPGAEKGATIRCVGSSPPSTAHDWTCTLHLPVHISASRLTSPLNTTSFKAWLFSCLSRGTVTIREQPCQYNRRRHGCHRRHSRRGPRGAHLDLQRAQQRHRRGVRLGTQSPRVYALCLTQRTVCDSRRCILVESLPQVGRCLPQGCPRRRVRQRCRHTPRVRLPLAPLATTWT